MIIIGCRVGVGLSLRPEVALKLLFGYGIATHIYNEEVEGNQTKPRQVVPLLPQGR